MDIVSSDAFMDGSKKVFHDRQHIKAFAIDRITAQSKTLYKFGTAFENNKHAFMKQFPEDNSFGQNSFDSLSVKSEFLSKSGTNSFPLI